MASNLIPIRSVIPGKNTPNRRELLWLVAGEKCYWCGQATRLVNDIHAWDRATIDHVIPRGKGGNDDPSNLVSACNRCNSRRNYEDACGLPEGSMLGKYKETQTNAERKAQRLAILGTSQPPQGKPNYYQHIALTGDEKKALFAKIDAAKVANSAGGKSAEDVLREQRDQAQKEIASLRKEMKQWEATIAAQEAELKAVKSMTVWKLVKKRIADWILS